MIERVHKNPDIYRIHIPIPENPLKSLNSYVVLNKEKPLVIDTGFNRIECENALLEGLQELNLTPGDCDLFITHFHSDHCGLAPLFSDAGSKIRMGSRDWVRLSRKFETDGWKMIEDIYKFHGFPEEEIMKQKDGNQARLYAPCKLFFPEFMEDGDEFLLGDLRFQCVWTPGHTPGHMCLYLPEQKVLFSGDHILYTITPNICVWERIEDSLDDFLKSIDKVNKLDIVRAFPAHREEGDLYDRVEELKDHHKNRLEELFELICKYPQNSAYELAEKMKWSARGKTWKEFSVNQKWFATGETIAHLIHLQKSGRVLSTKIGDVLVSRNNPWKS